MRVEITPGVARGTVAAPPSKSVAHRALIAAALAEGSSVLHHMADSDDIRATIRCLRALGIAVHEDGSNVSVTGGVMVPSMPLDCGESGSTLRFFLPLCLLSGKPAELIGAPRLLERPLTVYERLCADHGFLFRKNPEEITVCGRLAPGDYALRADISSQFITGMVLALLCLPGKSTIGLEGCIESESYILITSDVLRSFGFSVQYDGRTLEIDGRVQGYGREFTVEGDCSNAAFFEALNVLNGRVTVCGLKKDTLQGDRVYSSCFRALEAGAPTISLRDCPDLAPVLMAVAAMKNGAVFTDTARLRFKESDRGAAMAEELCKCGVRVAVEENRITVPGGAAHAPSAPFQSHGDHRIVMAAALLATRFGGTIEGAEHVAKSDPQYFTRLAALGIEVKKR